MKIFHMILIKCWNFNTERKLMFETSYVKIKKSTDNHETLVFVCEYVLSEL